MTARDSELKPAPGDLRIVQAFVNTADLYKGSDLAGPRALADWLALWGLAAPGLSLSKSDLKRAVEAREALRVLIDARADNALTEKAVEVLDRAAETATLRVRSIRLRSSTTLCR